MTSPVRCCYLKLSVSLLICEIHCSAHSVCVNFCHLYCILAHMAYTYMWARSGPLLVVVTQFLATGVLWANRYDPCSTNQPGASCSQYTQHGGFRVSCDDTGLWVSLARLYSSHVWAVHSRPAFGLRVVTTLQHAVSKNVNLEKMWDRTLKMAPFLYCFV